MKRTDALLLLVGAVVCVAAYASAQQRGGRGAAPPDQQPFVRTIEQVRGDLYKVISGPGVGAVTVFLVTQDGIILTDPLNPEFSAWLKGELATKFPGKPVRFVLASHYHWDHARGGGMFADTAKFIGHENMSKNLALPIRQARPPGDTDDLNGDDRLTREEAQTGTRANFDRFDGNADGFLTREEINADIRRPDVTFSDRYTLTSGGTRVELIWAKNRHTDDLFDVHFPDERVLFAGDYVWINRLCCNFSFDRRPMATWIASIRALEALDFDIVVTSHWAAGTKADVIRFREYLEDLSTQVQAGIKAGRSLEEIQKTVNLQKYSNFVGYPDQVPAIVQSAYNSLTN
ncbi:MAG: MBL fold metallo-hydrolase [Acidobacteria bacterium]|nr:MBL fold metallo-hydrolase [Acidobacteriota bacterium]